MCNLKIALLACSVMFAVQEPRSSPPSPSKKNPEILLKCQFIFWQLLSDYSRLALWLNKPFFIRRSHPPIDTDVPCILSVEALEYSCLPVNLPAIAAVFSVSVDAGLCFCILNWTFRVNLDQFLVRIKNSVTNIFGLSTIYYTEFIFFATKWLLWQDFISATIFCDGIRVAR